MDEFTRELLLPIKPNRVGRAVSGLKLNYRSKPVTIVQTGSRFF